MGANDPYAWMQGGRPKRPGCFFGPPTSPSLLYTPYGPAMGSPPFAMAGPYPTMYPQPPAPSKLPVQAMQRPVEHPRADSSVAPLVLPVNLGKEASRSDGKDLDPAAIPCAITSFLGVGEASATAGLNDNMRLYEMTFKAFVQEEAQIDYDNVTVVELKRLLRKYQLAATGKKEELIKMVKDVADFLKKLPTVKGGKGEEAKAEGKESTEENVTNGASGNKKDKDNLDRFLA